MNFIEIEPSQTVRELPDWSWWDPDGNEVTRTIERAARSIANKYEDTRTTEYDDAHQEALVLVATTPNLLDALSQPGLLYSRLCQDLTDKYKSEAPKRSRARLTSWEDNQDKLAGKGA